MNDVHIDRPVRGTRTAPAGLANPWSAQDATSVSATHTLPRGAVATVCSVGAVVIATGPAHADDWDFSGDPQFFASADLGWNSPDQLSFDSTFPTIALGTPTLPDWSSTDGPTPDWSTSALDDTDGDLIAGRIVRRDAQDYRNTAVDFTCSAAAVGNSPAAAQAITERSCSQQLYNEVQTHKNNEQELGRMIYKATFPISEKCPPDAEISHITVANADTASGRLNCTFILRGPEPNGH